MEAKGTKTSIELCAERYMALYEKMMVPWRFDQWCKDLNQVTFPLIAVEAQKAE